MTIEPTASPNLDELIRLFFSADEEHELGQFENLDADELPEPYRELLAHNFHMTVTVEKFHGSSVDVRVLAEIDNPNDDTYSRQILLCRQSDNRVVQYGIVRLHFRHLATHVVEEIRRKSTPLGRILIQNNVLREVELSKLWRVRCGTVLANAMGVEPATVTFGRTALIYCDGEPAVELLEIVAPVR